MFDGIMPIYNRLELVPSWLPFREEEEEMMMMKNWMEIHLANCFVADSV